MTVRLGSVPETLLWTLYHRAVEARRPDRVLEDPLAVDLVERIDYPFEERFGSGEALSQWQALRACAFDDEIRRFLAARPGGTVVALGEGLETQFWRVDDGALRWVTVDLPEVIELRKELLPADDRRRTIAASVADAGWLDELDLGAGDATLFTAQGLLMYLERDQVHALVSRLAKRRGAALIFDAIPGWLLERSRTGGLVSGTGYQPPPWSWAIDRKERRELESILGGRGLRRVHPPRGRGFLHGLALPAVARLPALREALLSIWLANVGDL